MNALRRLARVGPRAAAALPAGADPTATAPPPAARTHRTAIRRMGITGGVLLASLVLLAVFAPVVTGHAPDMASGRPYQPPSAAHPLGTDDVGHDLFAQLLFGARVSLTIGLLSALVAVSIGLAVALVAGYRGGRAERILMRLVDLTLAFPFLVLVLVLAAFFGRGLGTTVTVLAAVLWARPARVLRSQVLKLRELGHVTAARAMGASTTRILGRHILPRVAPLAVAQFVRAANVSVLLEASLSFLGLGDPNRTSWGTTLYFANARNAFLTDAWTWWIIPPGVALTATVLGLAFLGFAVEEWADPRLARTAPRHPSRRRRPPTARDTVPATTRQPGAPTLEVRDLSVEYRTAGGTIPAVDGVSFAVRPGRVVGLVGESGSGKSTIAMAVMGLLRPPARVTRGQVMLGGRDLRKLGRAALSTVRGRDVALIPQSAMNALNPAYTVHRQVAEAAALTRDPAAAAARATELLELVGIAAPRHGSYPHELSGGMRQRVVIAMALTNNPSLLVADEPVSGLDVVTQARILRLLLDLQARFGLAVLLISHDLPVVSRVADDILVMYGGRIVEEGTTQVVTDRPAHPYTQRLLQSFPSLRGPRRLASIPGEPLDGSRPASVLATTILELDHVTRSFSRSAGGRRAQAPVLAVDDVSLTVAPGEIVGLVGESGAGKSTLGRIILGLERPDTGTVRFDGTEMTHLGERAVRRLRRRMHLVMQDPYESLHPGMTVGEIVAEPLAIAGAPRAERARAAASAVDEVGLIPAADMLDRFPHQLSGGQRQRVAFARALVGRPRLVIADEPTSMLDASLRAGILDLMTGIRDRLGTAFILITHDLAVARHVTDRIAVMHQGRIVECGDTEDVIGSPRAVYTLTLLAASEGHLRTTETRKDS